MKNFLIALLVVLLSFGVAIAGEKTLTFEWEQAPENLPTLQGWKLFQSEDLNAAWPWSQVGDLIPYDGNPGSVYTSPFIITVPDGEETSLYFKMIAIDNQGQESIPSEMQSGAPTVIDFKPPTAPVLAMTYTAESLSANLTWTQAAADTDVVKWEIYKKEGDNPFVKIADVEEPAYVYDGSGDLGKTLIFAVVAFDDADNYSTNSNEVSVTIMPVPPFAPFGLKVTVSTQ